MECTKVNCPMQAGTPTDNCGENCLWRTTAKTGDLISRAAALDAIDGMKPMQGNMEQLVMKSLCYAAVKTIQPVDAAPVVHGMWIYFNCVGNGRYQCSECFHWVDAGTDRNYCPHCGAKMDKEARS